MSLLEVNKLTKNFGGVIAVNDLSFEVHSQEILGLIGPNGSGKSTTINLICGIFSSTSGNISLLGKELGPLSPNKRVEFGISRTFQNIRLFNDLTVWQNLWIAWQDETSIKKNWLSTWFGKSNDQRDKIVELLRFSGLDSRENDLAGNLSFGEQRRLELARALAAKPKLVLFDEPAAGMNSHEIKDLKKRILSLKKSGITVLLVEHVMDLVMNVVDRIVVLNFGKKIAQGTPQEIQENLDVQKAYFGSK